MERPPVVAGTFYDWDKDNLEKSLKELCHGIEPHGNIACVSPHAGYLYSGRTAAKAIGSLKPGKRFIILGPNHTGLGANFSIFSSGSWETPLGKVKIDHDLAEGIMAFDQAESDEVAHSQEHSIEVMLPFLQHLHGHVTFVPVTIMSRGYSESFTRKLETLGRTVADIIRKNPDVRVIASSDFSHYVSADSAKNMDMKTIDAVKKLDLRGFYRSLTPSGSVCGFAPIAVLMVAARELGWKADLIEYTNSGAITGDNHDVVAYAAIGFK